LKEENKAAKSVTTGAATAGEALGGEAPLTTTVGLRGGSIKTSSDLLVEGSKTLTKVWEHFFGSAFLGALDEGDPEATCLGGLEEPLRYWLSAIKTLVKNT